MWMFGGCRVVCCGGVRSVGGVGDSLGILLCCPCKELRLLAGAVAVLVLSVAAAMVRRVTVTATVASLADVLASAAIDGCYGKHMRRNGTCVGAADEETSWEQMDDRRPFARIMAPEA